MTGTETFPNQMLPLGGIAAGCCWEVEGQLERKMK